MAKNEQNSDQNQPSSTTLNQASGEKSAENPQLARPPSKKPRLNANNRVKLMHMHIGVDFIGSKTSMSAAHGTVMEATAIGIKATRVGKKKGERRIVVIPYSNVKGFELYDEGDEEAA